MLPLYSQAQFDQSKSRDLLPLQCEQCSQTFYRPKHDLQGHPRRFCSKACQTIAQKKPRITLQCKQCGKSIERTQADLDRAATQGQTAHFCSQTCAAAMNLPRVRRLGPKKRSCKACGKEYVKTENHQSTMHCPTCKRVDQYARKTLQEVEDMLCNQGKHRSWVFSAVRAKARYQHAQLLKNPCPICAYARHVELCHIKPITGFSKDTLLSKVNERANVIPLCRNCHWESHHGLISDEQLHAINASLIVNEDPRGGRQAHSP